MGWGIVRYTLEYFCRGKLSLRVVDWGLVVVVCLLTGLGGRNAEGGFGLICSCIPALHILVSRVKAKMRKGSRSSAIASGDGSGSGSGGKKRDRGVSSSGGTAAPIVITSSPEDVLHDPGGLLASCDDGDDVYDQNEEGEGRGEKKDSRDNREEGWV